MGGTSGDPYVAYADTRYYYDVSGNLLKVKQSNPSTADPGSWLARTTMTYDGYGRKLTMNDPDMGAWSYTYNATGSLLSQVDANQTRLCFEYDELNRLTRKRHDSNNNGCYSTDPQLAYYGYFSSGSGKVGKPSEIRWSSSSTQNRETFDYDGLGRLTSHTRIVDNRSYTMSYGDTTLPNGGFDAFQRPSVITYPDNEVITMTYDREGENSLTAGSNQLVNNIRYNGQGQMTFFDRGGSLADTTYSYVTSGSSLYRLSGIQHGSPNSDAKPDFTYTYDSVGNIVGLVSKYTPSGGSLQTDTQIFGYDHLNRLSTAVATGGVANYTHNTGSTDFNYGTLGNIIYFGNNAFYNYTNWNANCPTPLPAQAMPHAVKQIGSQYFCYDNNGNMTKRYDGSILYAQNFNVENELTSVVVNGQTTSFAYDAAGMRVKTVKPNGVVIDHPFPSYEVENPTGTAIIRRSYGIAGQIVATRVSGDPVSGNNGLSYFYGDHLGSNSALQKPNNAVVNTWYLPFGGYRGTAPTQTITDRDFTGQRENMELGLLYYNARYYVPGLGRFASADTIIPNPANPQSYNRYSYVRNSPLNFTTQPA
ncbi:MAG: hypothetical protein HC804_01455 [Anaerolineae bacterium]|nr:hypothetical protein [Anaerolineae bacterium]